MNTMQGISTLFILSALSNLTLLGILPLRLVHALSSWPRHWSHRRLPGSSNLELISRVKTALFVANLRDADLCELMVGGQRYEMVPLPDSMIETTLFVGNLCEFVKDEDLDRLFQSVSSLNSVPACVSRKPNWESLRYGFVTFPNVEEKERALLKFQGYELNGRQLKVECIRDRPGVNRVRVPEKMVLYMCGEVKKTSDGRVNTMRRVTRTDVDELSKPQRGAKKNVSSSDKNNRKLTIPSENSLSLSETEKAEMDRAERKGFVSLLTSVYRRDGTQSPLVQVHREWCDARIKPQIIFCKAVGGEPLDHIIVDLSPLRMHGILDDPAAADAFLVKWHTQTLLAAKNAGMTLREDSSEYCLPSLDTEGYIQDLCNTELVVTVDCQTSSAIASIGSLPVVSLGVFEGERSRAKAMAKELVDVWDIVEHQDESLFENSNSRRSSKVCGKSAHERQRRRDRNPYRR